MASQFDADATSLGRRDMEESAVTTPNSEDKSFVDTNGIKTRLLLPRPPLVPVSAPVSHVHRQTVVEKNVAKCTETSLKDTRGQSFLESASPDRDRPDLSRDSDSLRDMEPIPDDPARNCGTVGPSPRPLPRRDSRERRASKILAAVPHKWAGGDLRDEGNPSCCASLSGLAATEPSPIRVPSSFRK